MQHTNLQGRFVYAYKRFVKISVTLRDLRNKIGGPNVTPVHNRRKSRCECYGGWSWPC